jgi:hypothetical protein
MPLLGPLLLQYSTVLYGPDPTLSDLLQDGSTCSLGDRPCKAELSNKYGPSSRMRLTFFSFGPLHYRVRTSIVQNLDSTLLSTH